MKVAVLVGGRSGEHDVSLVTGGAVEAALGRLGHATFRLLLGRETGATWPAGAGTVADGLAALAAWGPDAAFIAMHGPFGEDGRVQGALEVLGVPYQGSGVAASAVAMDKARAKAAYRDAGLPVARDRVVRAGDAADWPALAAGLGLPVVLKTVESGSSVGVEVVDTAEALAERGPALLAASEALIAEEWLPGTELTVPVLEDPGGTARALPLIEIRPRRARFFDYETKYDPDAVDEICPAPIPDDLAAEAARLGLAAHRVLGCRDYSRTDLKVAADGRLRLLETNTLPGLTPASLFPKAAGAVGMGFDGLVGHLISLAASRRGP